MKKIAFTLVILLSVIFLKAQDDCLSFTLSQSDLGVQRATFGVDLADFDGDGWLDEVAIDAYDYINIHFSNGDGTLDTTRVILGADRWRFGVHAFDFDGDGDVDFITIPMTSTSDYGIELWENDGNGNFSLKTDQLERNTEGESAAIGDLDADGDLDIFYPSEDGIFILLNDGNGNFSEHQHIENVRYVDAELFDADNDGDLDAVCVVETSSSTPARVYLNDGNANFSSTGQELSDDNIEGVAAADIDLDGDMDLVFAPWSGKVFIMLNDGLANFLPGDTLFDGSSMFNEIYLKDLNFDNLPDIITDDDVWMNNPDTPGNFIHQNFSFSGSTHYFAMGDVNNDGFLDMVMGIFGSSTGDKVYLYDAPTQVETDTTICPGDTIFFENYVITDSGKYISAINCDTVMTLNVSLYDSINTTVNSDGHTLTAVAENVSYQWFDCNTNLFIDGATEQSFTPDSTGDYAVILSNGTCSFVSQCYHVEIPTDIKPIAQIQLYPNPADKFINIVVPQKADVFIFDITGTLVYNTSVSFDATIDITSFDKGIYIVKVVTADDTFTFKVLKNN